MNRDVLAGLLDRSTALILDMCGTFMFGHDRFGPAEKYNQTYRLLNGMALSDESVCSAIVDCFAAMRKIYEDPARHESFPSVLSTLSSLAQLRVLPDSELALLESVFTEHEIGNVPDDYAETLRVLSKRHRLALLTDIWSRKDKYVEELKRAKVFDLFHVMVFSSDGSAVKPSRHLFNQAVHELGVRPSEVLVVGDSRRRDIAGAIASGLKSIWIDSHDQGPPSSGPQPDGWVRDLHELALLVSR